MNAALSKKRLRREPLLSLLICAALMAGGWRSVAAAQGDLDCRPGAAVDTPAAPPVRARSGAFQILWHIGAQIEDIADGAGPDFTATMDEVQRKVDGYYFVLLANEALGYWPDRPAECEINLKHAEGDLTLPGDEEPDPDVSPADVQDACVGSREASLQADRQSSATAYVDALRRVVDKLNLREEQAGGKMIAGEFLLRNSEFDYDAEGDRIVLKRLPKTYCFLSAAGLPMAEAMAYQEPRVQIRGNRFLHVPSASDRKRRQGNANLRRDALPHNVRIVDMLGQSLDDAGVPAPRLGINVRRWNNRAGPRDFDRLEASPYFDGYFFEGGARIISHQPPTGPKVDNYAEGIAWVLANTDKRIFMLMPGFWERNEIGKPGGVDTLIDRLRETITVLDEKVGERLGLAAGEHAFCNERIHLVPGSYGNPVHMKTLPPRREDGRLAGTVTGEIELLAEMREEFCGVPS